MIALILTYNLNPQVYRLDLSEDMILMIYNIVKRIPIHLGKFIIKHVDFQERYSLWVVNL